MVKKVTVTNVHERAFNKDNTKRKMEDILFYARKAVTVPNGDEDNATLAMTAVKNLSDYGFIPDSKGIEALCTSPAQEISDWYYRTEARFRALAGADHEYNPFYPNFPEEVISKSELEMFLDQIAHYVTVAIGDILGETGGAWRPDGKNEKKGKKSLEDHPLKVIATVSEDELDEAVASIFKNTLASRLMPSKEDIRGIINAYIDAVEDWTKDAGTVENRKVLSYLYTLAVLSGNDTSPLPSLVTGDYLRIAQVYSCMRRLGTDMLENIDTDKKGRDGKVRQQRVTHLSKPLVRFIAEGLEGLANLEDIYRNGEQWKPVFRLMHVGAMKNKPNLLSVAQKLRSHATIRTFYSGIEDAYRKKDYEKAVRMYASRPGEFVKNLNRMLNVKIDNAGKKKAYAELLYKKAGETFMKARTEDLIRLAGYLRSRTREDRLAVHNVKGVLVQTEKKHEPIDAASAEALIALAKKAIATQTKKAVYRKAYIDSRLGNVPLPTEITDASDAMNAWPRGTRLPIEKNADGTPKNVRMFVWWTNQKEDAGKRYRVDLDLSAELFHKNKYKDDGEVLCTRTGSVSFHSCYGYGNGAITHSGDITDGEEYGGAGVCEYVDINIKELQNNHPDVDYIQVYVNSYTGQPFSEVPCLGGWQEREELDESDQFDPCAVKQTSKMVCASCGVTMAVVDVKNAEIVWVDVPNRKAVAASTSIDGAHAFDLILDRYMKGDQMTMKELAELSVAEAGAELTENMEEADVIFSMEAVQDVREGQRVITAKDQDIWLGEFMCPQEPEKEKEVVAEEKANEEPEKEPEETVASLIAGIAAELEGKKTD